MLLDAIWVVDSQLYMRSTPPTGEDDISSVAADAWYFDREGICQKVPFPVSVEGTLPSCFCVLWVCFPYFRPRSFPILQGMPFINPKIFDQPFLPTILHISRKVVFTMGTLHLRQDAALS